MWYSTGPINGRARVWEDPLFWNGVWFSNTEGCPMQSTPTHYLRKLQPTSTQTPRGDCVCQLCFSDVPNSTAKLKSCSSRTACYSSFSTLMPCNWFEVFKMMTVENESVLSLTKLSKSELRNATKRNCNSTKSSRYSFNKTCH